MYERSINISFPVKENILLSVKETNKNSQKNYYIYLLYIITEIDVYLLEKPLNWQDITEINLLKNFAMSCC